jgi:hypothetical protein
MRKKKGDEGMKFYRLHITFIRTLHYTAYIYYIHLVHYAHIKIQIFLYIYTYTHTAYKHRNVLCKR